MNELGKICVADDDETFLNSTADLLRREGYYCDCAANAEAAASLLAGGEHDLLIADIKMPGNGNLEFVRSLPQIARGLPAILVTGYPSLNTAIESVQLPVVSYLIKPLDFEELLSKVRLGMQFSSTFKAVGASKRRLDAWKAYLVDIEQLMPASPSNAAPVSAAMFLNLTMTNLAGVLADLKGLTEAIAQGQSEQTVCHLFNCPRPEALTEGLRETISVLEKTKHAFKSKDLGELRRKLEVLVAEAKQPPGAAPAAGASDTAST